MGIIYCYTNLINNKKYIGQTINPAQRYYAHKSAAFNEQSPEYNTPFHRAIRKYGYENFSYRVLVSNIEDRDELNSLECFYINYYNTQIPNGYNILPGGNNCSKPQTQEHKEKEAWSHGKLTPEEVIELRIAYKNIESPLQIYYSKYADRLTKESFMNIWTGKRYSFVMPEVFKDHRPRKTKLNLELARQIRKEHAETGMTHKELAEKYNVGRTTITNILNNKSWKEDSD